jgi:transcriptional regulator with XRE-family HTH domain
MGFRENLRSELAYSGLQVKEFSTLSGINPRSLSNYLNKRGQLPSIEVGVKIAKTLGITAEELVLGESYEKSDPELRAIGRLAKGLDSKRRKLALEMLKLLSQFNLNP